MIECFLTFLDGVRVPSTSNKHKIFLSSAISAILLSYCSNQGAEVTNSTNARASNKISNACGGQKISYGDWIGVRRPREVRVFLFYILSISLPVFLQVLCEDKVSWLRHYIGKIMVRTI